MKTLMKLNKKDTFTPSASPSPSGGPSSAAPVRSALSSPLSVHDQSAPPPAPSTHKPGLSHTTFPSPAASTHTPLSSGHPSAMASSAASASPLFPPSLLPSDLASLPGCRQAHSMPHDVLIPTLPALRDAPPSTRKALLLKKVRLCSYVFMFDDTQIDNPQEVKEKELKRNTLLELVNYLTMYKPAFSEEELTSFFSMICFNLFRPLPPSEYEKTGHYNPEEDEPFTDSSWTHLQIVYELLLRLASGAEMDIKQLDKHFSRKFILNLLELFDSEDARERDYLKTVLHRIYGNFMSLRPFIRRAINNIFYRFIYETDRHNGIAELLEILGSIINGFALPLKEQHKSFLIRVLLPLHKNTHMSVYHPQLTYCVTQFIEKDATLAPSILRFLFKFWPQTTSKKELMFLNELEEIMDRLNADVLPEEAEAVLFAKIAQCINSPHFQISERAIYILSTEVMTRFVNTHKQLLIPILAKSLVANTRMTTADETFDGSSVTVENAMIDRQLRVAQFAEDTIERLRQIKNEALVKAPRLVQQPAHRDPAPMQDDDSPPSPGFFSSNVMYTLDTAPPTAADTPDWFRMSPSPYPLSPLPASPHSLHLGHGSSSHPGHWNLTIVELTSELLKNLVDMDPECLAQVQEQRELEITQRARICEAKLRGWIEVDRMARHVVLSAAQQADDSVTFVPTSSSAFVSDSVTNPVSFPSSAPSFTVEPMQLARPSGFVPDEPSQMEQ